MCRRALVMHRAAVGGPHILTRVDGISRARWTAPLDGVCRYAQLVGGTLVVTTSNPGRRAIALDVATGGQRCISAAESLLGAEAVREPGDGLGHPSVTWWVGT